MATERSSGFTVGEFRQVRVPGAEFLVSDRVTFLRLPIAGVGDIEGCIKYYGFMGDVLVPVAEDVAESIELQYQSQLAARESLREEASQ